MAPPRNRRPGFSRKAQYSIFATYVLAVAGAVFAALLLVISVVDPDGFSTLRKAGSEITAPVSRFFAGIRRSFVDMSGNMSAYLDAAGKNRKLNEKLANQEDANIRIHALKLENGRLRALLNLQKEETASVATGRLISSSASSSRRLATLSVGANKDIEKGQAVRGAKGLIGRILEVGPTTARLLLISDADNIVPVMRLADGTPALSSGTGDGLLNIRPVNLGINPFKKGDIIVTSGNGGLYPPNIPFATIVAVTRDGAIARPIAEPGRTPYAMVLPIYQPDALSHQTAETGDTGGTQAQ